MLLLRRRTVFTLLFIIVSFLFLSWFGYLQLRLHEEYVEVATPLAVGPHQIHVLFLGESNPDETRIEQLLRSHREVLYFEYKELPGGGSPALADLGQWTASLLKLFHCDYDLLQDLAKHHSSVAAAMFMKCKHKLKEDLWSEKNLRKCMLKMCTSHPVIAVSMPPAAKLSQLKAIYKDAELQLKIVHVVQNPADTVTTATISEAMCSSALENIIFGQNRLRKHRLYRLNSIGYLRQNPELRVGQLLEFAGLSVNNQVVKHIDHLFHSEIVDGLHPGIMTPTSLTDSCAQLSEAFNKQGDN